MSTEYKAKSDSYLMRMTKAEIIEELREAECEISGLKKEFVKNTEYARKSVDKLEEENAELKRMLKIAVKDIDLAMFETVCDICSRGCDASKPCTWQPDEESSAEKPCYRCSNCGAVLEEDYNWHNHNFCYHCGARMDGEENESS